MNTSARDSRPRDPANDSMQQPGSSTLASCHAPQAPAKDNPYWLRNGSIWSSNAAASNDASNSLRMAHRRENGVLPQDKPSSRTSGSTALPTQDIWTSSSVMVRDCNGISGNTTPARAGALQIERMSDFASCINQNVETLPGLSGDPQGPPPYFGPYSRASSSNGAIWPPGGGNAYYRSRPSPSLQRPIASPIASEEIVQGMPEVGHARLDVRSPRREQSYSLDREEITRPGAAPTRRQFSGSISTINGQRSNEFVPRRLPSESMIAGWENPQSVNKLEYSSTWKTRTLGRNSQGAGGSANASTLAGRFGDLSLEHSGVSDLQRPNSNGWTNPTLNGSQAYPKPVNMERQQFTTSNTPLSNLPVSPQYQAELYGRQMAPIGTCKEHDGMHRFHQVRDLHLNLGNSSDVAPNAVSMTTSRFEQGPFSNGHTARYSGDATRLYDLSRRDADFVPYSEAQKNGVRLYHLGENGSGYGSASTSRANDITVYSQSTQPGANLGTASTKTPTEPTWGHGIRSLLLEEFKNNKSNRRYELRDIYHHIVEFSGDQHGSRFIQQKLETANSDEKSHLFKEILPNALQLMTDVFGNYVIQKFFEHGDQNQKKILAGVMQGKVVFLSNQVYGCRVVQKALEHVLVDQQAILVRELENNVLRCVEDQNGNHVIQKVIERVPPEYTQFIGRAFVYQVRRLATHKYGCRVVQRLLERNDEPSRTIILGELHACAQILIGDEFGNYVAQHVIERGDERDRARIISLVQANLVSFSKQKFASNVVEKCILHGSQEQRREIMFQFSRNDEHGNSALIFVIKDNFGNYVIQRLLEELDDHDYVAFTDILALEIEKAKRLFSGPCKQIENVAKKMHRFSSEQGQANNGVAHSFRVNDSGNPMARLSNDTMGTSSLSRPGSGFTPNGRYHDTGEHRFPFHI